MPLPETAPSQLIGMTTQERRWRWAHITNLGGITQHGYARHSLRLGGNVVGCERFLTLGMVAHEYREEVLQVSDGMAMRWRRDGDWLAAW